MSASREKITDKSLKLPVSPKNYPLTMRKRSPDAYEEGQTESKSLKDPFGTDINGITGVRGSKTLRTPNLSQAGGYSKFNLLQITKDTSMNDIKMKSTSTPKDYLSLDGKPMVLFPVGKLAQLTSTLKFRTNSRKGPKDAASSSIVNLARITPTHHLEAKKEISTARQDQKLASLKNQLSEKDWKVRDLEKELNDYKQKYAKLVKVSGNLLSQNKSQDASQRIADNFASNSSSAKQHHFLDDANAAGAMNGVIGTLRFHP